MLIVLAGCDGAGKSTQIQSLLARRAVAPPPGHRDASQLIVEPLVTGRKVITP